MSVKTQIKDSDPGFKRILANIKGPNGVRIGVFGRQGESLVIRASSNEFGAPSKNIPERSFLRAMVSEKRAALRKIIGKLAIPVIIGRTSKTNALKAVGVIAEGFVKSKIDSGPFVPNAPATIARKRAKAARGSTVLTGTTGAGGGVISIALSARPLIDEGIMKPAITHEVPKL